MNYEFKEISLDNYELHYTNKDGEKKIIPFKRTVALAKKLQSADANARMKLMEYMTERGKTKNDYIIERHEGEKIIRDETNYRELETQFIQSEAIQLADEMYKELFNMGLAELIVDMGVNENDGEKIQEFGIELREILVNGKTKTPSIQEIE